MHPPPHSLLRLSFRSMEDYRAYGEQNGRILAETWGWHETLGNQPNPISMQGICDLCECRTSFTVTPSQTEPKSQPGKQFDYRADWWLSLACGCNLSALDRSVMRILVDSAKPGDRVYHVGHHSVLRQRLEERLQNVVSSQYEAGRAAGETDGDIRYEDLTALSFDAACFDAIICTEILEHVPDYRAALREMARVLAPGGRAIMTFPWLGGANFEQLIRAEMTADGSINHILPPEYHGDPAQSGGILSFRAFGWKVLDDMREAGFSDVSVNHIFGPAHGYMTLLHPVIIGLR
jgi:SAM-dependent methyltransferase